ncbi:MAG: PocR ligand-binding domain-containing protein [Desulfobacteraceae bacterium]|nr:PocR ligand-binding domain-containing protein [Desulfobacteraceae bacterium]
MELTDVCSLETWAALEEEIYKRSGLNPAVYNIHGIRINANPRWPNRLCPEIKAIPKGQSFICATAHMNLANMAKQSKQPVIEECDAGMVKLVVPIFVNGTFLGAAGGCGLILDEGEVDTFLINKITELEEDKIEKLAQSVPSLTMQSAQELASFIQERLSEIVSRYQIKQGK